MKVLVGPFPCFREYHSPFPLCSSWKPSEVNASPIPSTVTWPHCSSLARDGRSLHCLLLRPPFTARILLLSTLFRMVPVGTSLILKPALAPTSRSLWFSRLSAMHIGNSGNISNALPFLSRDVAEVRVCSRAFLLPPAPAGLSAWC